MLSLAAAALLLAAAPGSADVGRFHLQSRFWVNLHQRLLYATRFESTEPAGTTPAEHAAWARAVDLYRGAVRNRVAFLDPGLIAIQAALSDAAGEDLPAALPAPVAEALRTAEATYRARQWADDDRANRFWIAVAVPQMEALGEEIVVAHERVYGTAMPKRVVVDVASHGWQFGAYTTGDPSLARTVLSSRTRGYEGLHVAEMVLHEASHAIDGVLMSDIAAASKELGRQPPPNLWHALLFSTSGEIARRVLASRGFAEYAPVSDEMYERVWRDMKPVVPAAWAPVVDGTATRQDAIRAILRALGKPGS